MGQKALAEVHTPPDTGGSAWQRSKLEAIITNMSSDRGKVTLSDQAGSMLESTVPVHHTGTPSVQGLFGGARTSLGVGGSLTGNPQ